MMARCGPTSQASMNITTYSARSFHSRTNYTAFKGQLLRLPFNLRLRPRHSVRQI